MVVVNPLRHDASKSFSIRTPLEGGAFPALARALDGVHGSGLFDDLDNKPVVASWTYVPSFRWGMVVQQRTAEAFTLTRAQRDATLWLLLFMMPPIILLAMAVANTITRPIRTAVGVAEKVAAGELDARFEIRSHDETGLLLTAIRSMTGELRELYGSMEDKIRARTRELQLANEELSVARVAAEAANKTKSAVPRQHEPRAAHAAQRHHRLQRDAAGGGRGPRRRGDRIPDLRRSSAPAGICSRSSTTSSTSRRSRPGKMESSLETVDIRSARQRRPYRPSQPLADKNGNVLEIACPDGLGIFRSDLTKVKQCLLNLLCNACKFTERGAYADR